MIDNIAVSLKRKADSNDEDQGASKKSKVFRVEAEFAIYNQQLKLKVYSQGELKFVTSPALKHTLGGDYVPSSLPRAAINIQHFRKWAGKEVASSLGVVYLISSQIIKLIGKYDQALEESLGQLLC
jgi:hypothetical protein